MRKTVGAIFAGRWGLLVGEDDQLAMILEVEPQDDPRRAVRQAMPAMISPRTSVKVVGGFGTSVAHMLTMAFADPTIGADLRETLAANEIVLGEEWTDGWHRLGVVCVTEGDEGLEQRLNTRDAVADVKNNLVTERPIYNSRVSAYFNQRGRRVISLAAAVCPVLRRQAVAKCLGCDTASSAVT